MSRRFLIIALLCAVISVAAFLAAEMLGVQAEPYWIATPVLCLPTIVLAVSRFPAALIPPVAIISAFKMQPAASNLDFRDPMFWTLILLAGTLLVHLTLTFVGIEGPSLVGLLRDQVEGITTYLIFVGVVAISYLYSLAPEHGFEELTRFMLFGAVLFFAPLLLVRSERDLRHLITSTVLLSMVLAGYEFFSRKPETIEDPTKLGPGQLTGIAMLLLLLVPRPLRMRLPTAVLILCIACLAAGLTISVARGPILSFALIIVARLVTSKADFGILPRKAMAAALVLIMIPTFLVSLSWLNNTAPEKVEEKEAELSNLSKLSEPGGTAGKRFDYYQQALNGFAEKPLSGWGFGSFSVYASGRDTRLHPHNLILLVAVEQGLVGLAALAAFLGALTRALKGVMSTSRGEWCFLLWVVLYCLCTSMSSGNLNDQRALILWCGVTFASWRIVRIQFQGQRCALGLRARR